MVWNKKKRAKALIIGALKVRPLGDRLRLRMGRTLDAKAPDRERERAVTSVAGNRSTE